MTTNTSFQPGARFTAADFVTLLAAGGLAWWGNQHYGPWVVRAIAFVFGTFFLFGNVFRVARAGELLWAVVFVVLAGIRLRTGAIEWSTIYAVSGAVALFVIVAELRKPSYHGLGWSRVNPGLEEWWRARISSKSAKPSSTEEL
jgi:hypothetical protein